MAPSSSKTDTPVCHSERSEESITITAGGRADGFFASLRMTAGWICRLPVRALSALIWIYQKTVSPALVVLDPTGGCRFAPTCSHYARGALAEHGFIVGTALTLRRLAKCGPWHPGGEDPVPVRARPVCTKVSAH